MPRSSKPFTLSTRGVGDRVVGMPLSAAKSKENQRFSGIAKYYGYRYYHPQTGRWPSRDPIHEMSFNFPIEMAKFQLEIEIFNILQELDFSVGSYVNSSLNNYQNSELSDFNVYAFCVNNPISLMDRFGLEPIGGSGSNYRPDPFGHGRHPNGAPIDPHVDRIDPNGNKSRCNPDGSQRGGAPKVPKKDLNAFKRALEKLREICKKCPKPPGGAKLGGGMMVGPDEMDSIIETLRNNYDWAKNLETTKEMMEKCKDK
jgi:hypothetical protein